MFGQRLTFFVGPKAQGFFFRAKDDELSQREVYTFSVPIFGNNIVYDCDEGTRLEQFRLLALALKGDKVKGYTGVILQEAEDYFKRWTGEGKVCIRSAMSELIILTASRALMGEEVRENLFEEVSRLYAQLDEGLTAISFFLPYLPIPAHKRRDQAREEMVKLFSKVIQKRREEGRRGDDMLQVFMDGEYKDGRKFTDNEVTGLLIALLFAGQHTSSVSSSWTGLLVLNEKEKYWPRLKAENEQVLKESGGKVTFDALLKMELLGSCIREAIRMYPPLIFLMRKVKKDLYYKSDKRTFKIPKGDIAFVSPAAGMRQPESFENPDKYDPDRFMPGREEDKKQSYAWVGFGGGRHGCMGEMYAYLQIKIIWTVLLRDFDMDLVGDLPLPNYEALVVGPSSPCDVTYKRIKA